MRRDLIGPLPKGVLARSAALLLLSAPSHALVAANPPIPGFVDTHVHQFANLGFGGVLFQGAPFSPDGDIATALHHCDFVPPCSIAPPIGLPRVVNPLGLPVAPLPVGVCPGPTCPSVCAQCPLNIAGICVPTPTFAIPAHGPGGTRDLVGNAVSGYFPGHSVGGNPEFDGWPRWDTSSHQQVYYAWLHRAFQGGLKLMVMLAVNNEMLCKLSNQQGGFGCNDMAAVDRQIQAAKDLEQFIDHQSGGPGRGWYRIAYSGRQARQIINSGKMAVVLGAEVPSLFNCHKNNAACDETHVRNGLQRYHDMGLRHLFPIHNADNRFGGTAIYDERFNFSNKIITGDYWDVGGCPAGSGIDFHLGLYDRINNTLDVATAVSILTPQAAFLFALVRLTGLLPPRPPAGPNCNRRGLTRVGEFLINEMMDKKMIIDVDHTSVATLEGILQIAERRRYPALVMGHTGFLENNKPGVNKKAECNKTGRQLERVRDLGGLVSVILPQGEVRQIEQFGTKVSNDCGRSSKTWAQAYLYAVDKMRGGAVGVGSDFNGFAGGLAPRFARSGSQSEACAGERLGDQGAMITYPFLAHGTGVLMNRSGAGNRKKTFDYNFDGFAHIGMYPDFIQDLKTIRSTGITDDDLRPLFSSAEAYVNMWERAEDRSLAANTGPE